MQNKFLQGIFRFILRGSKPNKKALNLETPISLPDNAFIDKNSDFSVDEFLYARCCVVANSADFYAKVLKKPSLMPKNLTFEALLRVAHKAYFQKTGKQFRYVPTYNMETFANSY